MTVTKRAIPEILHQNLNQLFWKTTGEIREKGVKISVHKSDFDMI